MGEAGVRVRKYGCVSGGACVESTTLGVRHWMAWAGVIVCDDAGKERGADHRCQSAERHGGPSIGSAGCLTWNNKLRLRGDIIIRGGDKV